MFDHPSENEGNSSPPPTGVVFIVALQCNIALRTIKASGKSAQPHEKIQNARKDSKTVFKVLTTINEPDAESYDMLKLIQTKKGTRVSNTADIQKTFQEYWKEMFNHEGENLETDIQKLKPFNSKWIPANYALSYRKRKHY